MLLIKLLLAKTIIYIHNISYMIYYDLNKYFDINKQIKIDKQAIKVKNYYFLD